MDVREKLVKQAISHFRYGVSHDIFSEPVTTYAKLAIEALEKANGVTVQECKLGAKKTNADRIRSMSNVELAEQLGLMTTICEFCAKQKKLRRCTRL